MSKSYKTQLLERISDYRNQIEEIDQEVDQLVKESKKGFLAFLFGARDKRWGISWHVRGLGVLGNDIIVIECSSVSWYNNSNI